MDQPEWPLLVFRDDTTLEICESLEDARREYEGIDVEAGVYSFFDFTGYPVLPVFKIPNHHSKFLGLIPSCSSGEFEFDRDLTSRPHDIAIALSNAEHLTKNQLFETLDDVCHHLERRGCCMEQYHSNRESKKPNKACEAAITSLVKSEPDPPVPPHHRSENI